MMVKELFEHFGEFFDTIIYFDVSSNIQDSVTIVDGDRVMLRVYDDFMREYGGYNVTDWSYRNSGNGIDINIEKDDYDYDDDMVGDAE